MQRCINMRESCFPNLTLAVGFFPPSNKILYRTLMHHMDLVRKVLGSRILSFLQDSSTVV